MLMYLYNLEICGLCAFRRCWLFRSNAYFGMFSDFASLSDLVISKANWRKTLGSDSSPFKQVGHVYIGLF